MNSVAFSARSLLKLRPRRYAIAVAIVVCLPLTAHAQPSAASGALAKELQNDLGALASLASASRATSTAATSDALPRARQLLERIRAIDLLIQEQQRAIDERLQRTKASGVPLQRQQDHARLFRERMDRLYLAGEPLTSDMPAGESQARAAFAAIAEALGDAIDTQSRTPIGAILPYRSLSWPQVAPQPGAAITPAYLTAPVAAPQAADLAETPDTLLTDAIRNQAAALSRDAIAIFEFVQNSVRSEFYYGAMKDASDTLGQLSGNDTDQASLLVALLRASQVPARYVRGVIRLTGAQAVSWTGAGSTRRAAEIFTRAGIPFRPILQGGSIGAFEIEHTWVEAYVPYSNYRGVRLGTIGRAWIPLDPSFKAVDVTAGEDVLAAMGFNAGMIVTTYLSQTQALAPMDFYRNAITTYLTQIGSPLTVDDVLSTRTTRANQTGLLPSTLPYAVVSIHGESPELPASLRHRVRFVAEGEGGLSFDVTIPAAELAGRRLTLSYIPATVDDQAVAHSFLGLDNTPAYLVKLRPVLKIGGVVKAAGSTPVQMGGFHSFTVEIQTPRGAVPVVNSMLAGGYYALGLATQPAAYELPLARAPDDTEHPAADRLYSIAIDYIRRWSDAEHTLERLLRVVNVRPILSQVIVGTAHARTVVFGQPQAIEWRGVFVDADLRVAEPVPTGADDTRAPQFLRLSALAGSVLEADVLRLNLGGVDAVSAASVIQLARDAAIPIEEINAANLTEVLARLQTPDIVKTEIADAVNQGWRVTIPQRDLTRRIWTGIGYVMIDPATGAGGYFISGGLAGGISVLPPEDWPDEPTVEELNGPNAEPPNDDPASVRFLTKVAITDKQIGTVDQPLDLPMKVWARDAEGRPVKNATVIFMAQSGGGRFAENESFTTTTNHLGIATAPFRLGRTTSAQPFYVRDNPGDLHVTQVGQNIVTAFAASDREPVILAAPFQQFAYPGAPVRIVKVLGDHSGPPGTLGTLEPGLFGGSVLARVEDQFENPVSNVPVRFTVMPAQSILPSTLFPPAGAVNLRIYPHDPACAIATPVLGDCGAVDGFLDASTSSSGAAVNTILGNTVGTTFSVQASIPSLTGVPSQTFQLLSRTARGFGNGTYYSPELMIMVPALVGDRGRPINASRAGTVLPRPLEAVLMLREDDYVLEPIGLECPNPDDPCYRLRSLETSRIRPIDVNATGDVTFAGVGNAVITRLRSFETATVRFTPAPGVEGTTTPPVNTSAGRYASTLQLGLAPALNTIDVSATAVVWAPCFDLHLGTVTPMLLQLAAGQNVIADSMFFPYDGVNQNTSCVLSGVLLAGGQPHIPQHQVFGVRAAVSDLAAPVSTEGLTLESHPIEYLIQPALYSASVADVDLFEIAAGAETWRSALTGSARSGEGAAALLQGTVFDVTKTYETELVLNRGTEVEIRSPRARLSVLNPIDLTLVADQQVGVKTYVDRVFHTASPTTGRIQFGLSEEARVTVQVDGQVLTSDSETGPVVWQDVTLPPGFHSAEVEAGDVTAPGQHAFTITATFAQPGQAEVVRSAAGVITHEIIIQGSLAVGHTLVKGVDVVDGHISLSREDLSIPGHGPALQFTRSYGSSGNRVSGPMGAGWSHNYDAKVVRDPGGTITVVGGEGSGIKFANPVSGTDAQGHMIETFGPQPGYHGRLIRNVPDGSYDYYTKHHVRHHYERAFSPNEVVVNRLAFIEDSHGNRLRLTYETQAPFNLKSVTDASGRTLTFTYQPFGLIPENRVTRIDGPLELVVTYDYDQYGNLVRAVRDVKAERYEYSIGNPRDRHNITRVIGPNNGAPDNGGTGENADVMEIGYFLESDQIPGWIPNPTLFAEKYDIVRSLTEGAGSPQAAATQFAYNYTAPATGFVTTVTDPLGVDTVYTIHSGLGAVLEKRVVLPGDDNVTITRWAFQDGINDVFMTQTTDPNGRMTTFAYDAKGNPRVQTIHADSSPYALPTNSAGFDAGEVVSESHYDPVFGRVTREIDAEGHVTDHDINPANGNVRSVTTYPEAGLAPITTRYAYFDSPPLRGLLRTVTDPRGRVTTYATYDDFGNATRIVDPEGNFTDYRYDARGRRREVRDSRGHVTIFEYDVLDRTTRVTQVTGAQPADLTMASPLTRETITTYFPGGQPRTGVNGNGHLTTFAYDALNRPVLQEDVVQDADGAATTLRVETHWDGNGNRIRELDRRQSLHEFRYDNLNRLIETRVEGQLIASQTYDAAGNRLSETDLHGHTTSLELDGLYRPIRTIFAIPQYSTRTRYDLVGNVLESTDAGGSSIFNTYDGINRLTSTTDAFGQTKRIDHDAAGNRVLEHDLGTGLRVHYDDYDGINRPAAMRQVFVDPLTEAAVTYTTQYAYLDVENTRVTTSPRGVQTVERYNGLDALIERIVDPAGLQLRTTYRYDGNGNLTGEKDSEGGVIDAQFVFDGLNRRISATYPLGGHERWFYDGNGNVTRMVDRRDIVRTTAYDHLNRKTSDTLVESISNGGAELVVTRVDYDDPGNSTTVTDANGNTTRQFDDAMHRPVRTVDALNQETRHEWDASNRRAQVDKLGIRTEFDYDRLGRSIETRRLTTQGPQVTRVEYLDAQSRRVETDPGEVETITQFDALQRPRRTSKRHPALAQPYGSPEILVEEHEYDAHGNVVAIVDSSAAVTRFAHDNADRVIEIIGGFGSPVQTTTTMTYDKAGNLLTTKDGRLTGRSFDARSTYDVRNRKVLSENGAGETVQYFYDQADNLRMSVEPLGGSTIFTHDEVGKLLSVDQTRGGAGGVTRYRYDSNRNLIAQQDASGNLSTWRYDVLNRQTDSFQHTVPGVLAAELPRPVPDGGDETTALHWHYGYDANGNQRLIVDAEGQRVVKSYDELERVAQKTYHDHRLGSDGAPIFPRLSSITYQYDDNGNLTRSEEIKQLEGGSITETSVMQYDPINRLILKTNPDGKTLHFEYDRAGNQTAIVDADDRRTTHTYDALNRITSTTVAGLTTTYVYWPDSLQRTVTHPNGVAADMSYDPADRLTRITNHDGNPAAPISQFDYTYDSNGNRRTQIERHARLNGGAAQQTTYRYDALNRLAGVDHPGAADMTYVYTPNSNRVSESGTRPVSESPIARTYTYNRLNQLTAIADAVNAGASVVLQYDRNGNTITQKVGTIDPSSGDVPAPTATKTYDFDIRDQLARATGSVGPVTFDYDHLGRRVKMSSPVASIRYLHDANRVVQEYDGSSLATTLRYTYGPAGLSSIDAGASGGRSFYSRDALGSTSELTDASGVTQASYSYDPWGQVLASFDTTPNRRRFTGHYSDTETGLQFFGARYYDETTGRFLSQDSYLGEGDNPATLHRYQYALANPLRYVDPTGYASEEAKDDFDVGNPCHGETGPCNPATKDVDDYVKAKNEEYLARARAEGEELAAMLGRPGGGDPLTGEHSAPTGIYKTRSEIYKKFDRWQRTEQMIETERREELLARIDEAAQGGLGDMATFRFMLLAEEIAAADPDSILATGTAALVHGTASYLQSALNLGAATGELAGKYQSGQDITALDVLGAVGDVVTLLEPVGAAISGGKQVLKAVKPTSAAIASEQAALKLYAHVHDLTIGIRAADPITATVTKTLTYIKLAAKPETVKAKSTFGLARDGWKFFRSDLDIAYIKNAAGEMLDNTEVLRIVDELNAMTGLKSFQHGSHISGFRHAGGGPAAALSKYAKFGNPGAVTEFTATAKTTLSEGLVRGIFASESLTNVPKSLRARAQAEQLVGRWHTAWDAIKPHRSRTGGPIQMTPAALMEVERQVNGKDK
jgi:RHS repeat-associated protein